MKRLLILAILMAPGAAFAMEGNEDKKEAHKPPVDELRDKLGEGNGGTVAGEEEGELDDPHMLKLRLTVVEEEPSLREVMEQMKESNIAASKALLESLTANTEAQTRVAAAFERLADAQERTAQVQVDAFVYQLLVKRNAEDVVMRVVTGPPNETTKRSHQEMYKEPQERYFADRTKKK